MSRFSTKSLLRAALLIGVLVPIGAGAAQASSFTFSPGNLSHEYDFTLDGSGVSFTLAFNSITAGHSFGVDVGASTSPTHTLPTGYPCIPITGVHCVEFTTTSTAVSPTDFDFYRVLIKWDFNTDTNPRYQDDPGGRVRMFQYEGDVVKDVTVEGSYFSPDNPPSDDQCKPGSSLSKLLSHEDFEKVCGDDEHFNPGFWIYDFIHHRWVFIPFSFFGFSDPGVAGVEDSFSNWDVGDLQLSATTTAAVPEPGTVLIGSGLAGVIAVRRRRKI